MMLSYYKTYKYDIAIARPFNTYGPRQNEGVYAAVIPITLDKISSLFAGEPPEIHSDGKQTRDFIYVADTVKGIIDVYKNERSRGQEINIAYGQEIQIGGLVKLIAKEMDYKGKIVRQPSRPADVRRHLADTRLAKKLLGWQPTVDLSEWLKGYKKEIGL